MPDFIFTRMFYVIFKIVEAFVSATPIILIQLLLNVVAQILVLTTDSPFASSPSHVLSFQGCEKS